MIDLTYFIVTSAASLGDNAQYEKDWAGDTPLFSKQQKETLQFGKKKIKKLRPPFWFQLLLLCIAVFCVMTSAVFIFPAVISIGLLILSRFIWWNRYTNDIFLLFLYSFCGMSIALGLYSFFFIVPESSMIYDQINIFSCLILPIICIVIIALSAFVVSKIYDHKYL